MESGIRDQSQSIYQAKWPTLNPTSPFTVFPYSSNDMRDSRGYEIIGRESPRDLCSNLL